MTNYHSNELGHYPLNGVYCDGCGRWYQELQVLVFGRRNGLIKILLCIECDPDAEYQQDITVLPVAGNPQ